uniref:Uncharacterized protein n=1 Tax=Parascaris univalens TaxID=6257 RepID=A0A915AY27_PARUN
MDCAAGECINYSMVVSCMPYWTVLSSDRSFRKTAFVMSVLECCKCGLLESDSIFVTFAGTTAIYNEPLSHCVFLNWDIRKVRRWYMMEVFKKIFWCARVALFAQVAFEPQVVISHTCFNVHRVVGEMWLSSDARVHGANIVWLKI